MNTLISFTIFILGALLGSFIGVVAERIYTGQSWKRGRSRCNSCRENLVVYDLIPILSWLLHKGRCRMCGSRIPSLYTLYEFGLGISFVLAFRTLGIGIPLLIFLLDLLILAFIIIYDIRHTVVPPMASSLCIIISAIFALYTMGISEQLLRTVFYAIGIALFLFSLYFFSRGRAMGLGDTPVSFALSLLVGTHALAGLLFSFWIGSVIGIGILVSRRGGPTMGIEVPFVPMLALGYLLAYFSQWNPLPF